MDGQTDRRQLWRSFIAVQKKGMMSNGNKRFHFVCFVIETLRAEDKERERSRTDDLWFVKVV